MSSKPLALTPIFTKKGFLLLGCILIGPLIALLADLPIEFAASFVSLVIAFYAFALFADGRALRKALESIEIEANLQGTLLSGRESYLRIQLRSASTKKINLKVRPEIPQAILIDNEELGASLSQDSPKLEFAFYFTPTSRGSLRWNALWIQASSRFALCRWQYRHPLENISSTVLPNAYHHRKGTAYSVQRMPTGYRSFDFSGGEGREFDRLRRYHRDDDLRRVDWKRSARRNDLLVKVYRPESHQRLQILLDCSRRMGNSVEHRLQMEYAADAAAHLAKTALAQGDEVGLFAFHHRPLASIGLRRGDFQSKRIIQTLSKLEIGSLEANYALATNAARRNRRRTLLVMITSISSAAGLQTMRDSLRPLCGKHLPLIVAISDRDLEKLAEQKVDSLEDAYVQAASWEQLQTIRAKLASFKKTGIESIYADAKDIPARLGKKYYELKLGGRL